MGLLLAVLITLPRSDVVLDYDALHYNTLLARRYDPDGVHYAEVVQFRQVGGLELLQGEYRWCWWRIDKADCMRPYWRCGWWHVAWYDAHDKRAYHVRGRALFETTTYSDPEVLDRAFLPESQRRGLK